MRDERYAIESADVNEDGKNGEERKLRKENINNDRDKLLSMYEGSV